MVNCFYLRVVIEVFNDPERVLYVAFNSERKCFKSLEEDESMERRECSACVSQEEL